jgi:hypothetical protein
MGQTFAGEAHGEQSRHQKQSNKNPERISAQKNLFAQSDTARNSQGNKAMLSIPPKTV